VAAGAVFAFIRSPLFNPGNYAVPSSTSQHPKPKRPHVLWVVMDTVRGDHTNMYGYSQPTTPRLAAFADGALVFDRAIANGIWTLPNHASMFSGRGLREHGTDFRHARLDAEFTTVAEILRDHGYATAAFSNNPWVAPDTEITRGFDTAGVIYHLRHVTRSSIGWMFERIGMPPPFPWLDEDFGGAMTNALTADWLDARARHDQPMFLFVNYMDAHLPYRVPARYRRMFLSPEQVRRSFALSLSAYGRIVDAVDRRFNFEDQSFFAMADREVLKGQYDAGIRYLDDRVSELLDMYRQRGLLDNTLVVITSDHGEYLDQHGQWAHRMQVYQDLLNVVIMLRPPGLVQGRRVETPVQLADLYATVIGATVGDSSASAREPSETFNRITWPARDLFAIAAEAPDPQRVAVSEYGSDAQANIQRVRERDDPALKRRALPQVAAQDARYKLMVTADGTQELFDVIADPREEHDLLTVFPEHAERLGRYLAQWHERVPQHQPPEAADPSDMDPDVIRALKSLGYLGDD
jgi:arylsulfatase A-like enzyme